MITLAAGDLRAQFAPEAGMVCASLRHRGAELLGQRSGLAGYVAEHKTFGIPLLYPWANRLGEREFAVAVRASGAEHAAAFTVAVTGASPD